MLIFGLCPRSLHEAKLFLSKKVLDPMNNGVFLRIFEKKQNYGIKMKSELGER